MDLRNRKGFTLIEVIVVAGIIAILAGILVPLIFKEIDEARITRAAADIRSISTGILILRKDAGQWPVSATCRNATTMMVGHGTVPAVPAGWDNSATDQYDHALVEDTDACWGTKWKGPYIAMVNADPWGNAYVTNAPAMLAATGPIWIMSAGPNGTIETAPDATSIGAGIDDIGVRLR